MNFDWIGGFFDGEGCIYYNPGRVKKIHKNKEYKYPEFQILLGQSKEEGKILLERITSILDWGPVKLAHPGTAAKSPAYIISKSGKHAMRILKELLPHLIHKKKRGEEILELMENYYSSRKI